MRLLRKLCEGGRSCTKKTEPNADRNTYFGWLPAVDPLLTNSISKRNLIGKTNLFLSIRNAMWLWYSLPSFCFGSMPPMFIAYYTWHHSLLMEIFLFFGIPRKNSFFLSRLYFNGWRSSHMGQSMVSSALLILGRHLMLTWDSNQ